MKPTSLATFTALAAAAVLSLGANASADQTAFTGTYSSDSAGYGLNALVFTINAPITVDSLGFYADKLNAGGDSPDVDLYSVVSLDSGAVTAGTELATTGAITPGDYTASGFNYYSIAPITLQAGTYMVAGGLYWTPTLSDVTYASAITSATVDAKNGWNGNFDPNTYATLSAGTGGVGSVYDFTLSSGTAEGVNFEFTPSVPEPASYALIGVGLAGLVGWRLLRRKVRA